VVYAAASLTESFQELERVFRARPDGCALLLNFGGSSWLRTQIEQGAYADVFASANEPQMDRLVRGNRVEPPCTFAENRLTLLIPRSNPGGIETLGDLARPGVRLLLAHSTVPIGYYAEKVLEKLPEVLPLPDGYTQDTLANVVSRETTVKQVVAKVALGEADAGFVYVSDLRPQLTSRVRSLDVPEAANQRARYPVAVLRESRHPELARAFLDFLLSQPGQEILAGFRFLPVAP
jgi:molybdate transport system substrate-binding protein